jgi:hypothetical protein
MFYTVHSSIITNENQQNAQMIYIYFFSICSTYMFRSCLTIISVRCYRVSNKTMCAFVQGVTVYKHIFHNPHIVWYVFRMSCILVYARRGDQVDTPYPTITQYRSKRLRSQPVHQGVSERKGEVFGNGRHTRRPLKPFVVGTAKRNVAQCNQCS